MTRFRTVEFSDPEFEQDGVRFVTVQSPALGRRADVTVCAVPGTPAGAPLVTLLHGVYSSHWAWTFKGGAHRTLASLVARGEIPPVVLAMPSDGLRGPGSGYVKHGDEDVEAWIVREVPEIARFVVPGAGDAGVCIGGLSMGGFAALRLAARYPKRYVAAFGLSSATRVTKLWRAMLKDNPARNERLFDTIASARATMPPFGFACGAGDYLIEDNRALHARLERAKIPHVYAESDGAHDWDYWSAHLPDMLRFFARHLAARG